MKKEATKKQLKNTNKEEEKLLILAKSDEIKTKQLVITDEGIESEDELKNLVLQEAFDNPTKKYDIHYNGISKLLMKHLPKGKNHEKARHFIYEEKNTYLTRGNRKKKDGTRGADSRMGYINDHQEILNLIVSWIRSNGTMADLYISLKDLNKTKGYLAG